MNNKEKGDHDINELNEFELLIETIDTDAFEKNVKLLSAEAIGELVAKAIATHKPSGNADQLFSVTIKRWNSVYTMDKTLFRIDQNDPKHLASAKLF